MNTPAGLFLAALAAIVPSLPAWAGTPDAQRVPTRFLGACDIAFNATSTLHDISGSARCQPFTVRVVHDARGREMIPSVEVEVAVDDMDTRNRSRDRQMRKMLGSDRYPSIRGAAHDVDIARLRGGAEKNRGRDASIDLLLRIRDVERTVHATVNNLKESGGHVTFDLEFPLSIGEFNLKAPSVLGFIRVGDKVFVKAAFTLTVSGSQ